MDQFLIDLQACEDKRAEDFLMETRLFERFCILVGEFHPFPHRCGCVCSFNGFDVEVQDPWASGGIQSREVIKRKYFTPSFSLTVAYREFASGHE